MTENSNALPDSIRRPLFGASLAIVAFFTLFFIWAIYAPLATTITLHGTIQSARPSIALQHPYGGVVNEVLVDVHDPVETGQILLRFDTELERKTLAAQSAMRNRLQAENNDIEHLLGGSQKHSIAQPSPLISRQQQVALQIESSEQTSTSLVDQIEVLTQKIVLAESQVKLMSARAERIASLTSQGLTRRSEMEVLQEQILLVKGEVEADRATILNLENQITGAQQQMKLVQANWQYEISSIYQRNLEKLDQLEGTILNLTDRIEKSVLRAPTDGVVASLPIDAEHLLAKPGATLVTIAHPLRQAQISFFVPVGFIDQIRPNMSARLIIPSLPQRQMPKIDVRIEAISPRARVDENGNPTSYMGLALLDWSLIEQGSGEGIDGLSLTEDMPVMLAVAVRQTTFADYLMTPFLSAFSRALQD